MRAVIIPGLTELRIKVNPARKVSREGLPYILMPWMFAPWPDVKDKGVIEIEVKGETLRRLLIELSDHYKRRMSTLSRSTLKRMMWTLIMMFP